MTTKGLPAFRYMLYFCTGIIIGMIIRVPLLINFFVLFITIILLVIFKDQQWIQILFICCIVLCGSLRISLAEAQFREKHAIPEIRSEMELEVLKQKTTPYFIKSYIVKTKIGPQVIKGTLYAKKGLPVLIPGRIYYVSHVKCLSITSNKNPYVFNYLNYAKVHGLTHSFQVEKHAKIEDLGIKRHINNFSYLVRSDISVRFLSVLGIEKGSLVNGLLLGLKSEIPVCIASLFRQLGVSHLLAVSGLHVGLIILIIYQILLSLSIPRLARVFLIAFFLIFYCFITGGSPSVIRSSLMSVMLIFAPVFRRKYQALNAVAASAVILLLANPFSIQDLGFQFSFSAVFGILIAYPKIRSWFSTKAKSPLVRYILDMLAVSLSAALFTSPVAIYYFNSLQIASMLLNILVIPLTFCVMICAILCLPGIYISSIIADLNIQALDLSLNVFRGVLRLASRSGIWTIQISSYWKPIILTAFIVCLIFICIDQKKWRNRSIITVILSCSIWFYFSTRPELVQLALKRGESIVYRKGRQALIIDTGAAYFNYNDHDRYIQPILDQWGINNVTIVISTWKKGRNSNIGSIRRKYPQCQVLIPKIDEAIEEDYMQIKNDTIIYCGNTKIEVTPQNEGLSIKLQMGKEFLNYENDILSINSKCILPQQYILFGNYLLQRE
ncbi:MAG: ComEC/Rec2 family competence protein [Candidatus Marinimicrobia bacterium]|nr:ComEC/Rec2 family competence protein [Candidatus Neomarinimicrobiota bacterium]